MPNQVMFIISFPIFLILALPMHQGNPMPLMASLEPFHTLKFNHMPYWPSILVIFAYHKPIHLPPYSILFHLQMLHFTLIFHIQVTKVRISIFRNVCKNWVLRVNLDCIKNSRNSFVKVISAGHMGER